MFQLDKKDADPVGKPLLTIDRQNAISERLLNAGEQRPLIERLIFPHAPFTNVLALAPLSFYSWRAGFRGYGLSKYNRGRLMTVFLAVVYPSYGGFAAEIWSNAGLIKPFRKENPWHHAAKFALVNQVGTFITISGNICLSFLVATKSGLLPIPEGMHKPGIRQVAAKMMFGRIKPYRASIALSAAFSTAVMFVVGWAAYQESCAILNKMNRKTLIYQED